MQKQFITADELQQYAFELSMQILQSDFTPSHILVVWRGGATIGITVHEVLNVCGVLAEHLAVRVSSYAGIGQREAEIRIQDITGFAQDLRPQHRLLIIDDVHDTGLSMQALLNELQTRCAQQLPELIKIATVFYKPDNSQVNFEPDYYLHKTDNWLLFPHELQGLSKIELSDKKPHISTIRQQLIRMMMQSG